MPQCSHFGRHAGRVKPGISHHVFRVRDEFREIVFSFKLPSSLLRIEIGERFVIGVAHEPHRELCVTLIEAGR